MRAAPDPRILTGWSGASPHVLRFPPRAFLRFPVCPPGSPLRPPSSGFPSSGVLRFVPFGRPRFRCPFGVPPGSLPLSNLHDSAAKGRFRRRWSRAARAKVTSPAATPRLDLAVIRPALQTGSGWAQWDAATESPVTSGRERRTPPRPNNPDQADISRAVLVGALRSVRDSPTNPALSPPSVRCECSRCTPGPLGGLSSAAPRREPRRMADYGSAAGASAGRGEDRAGGRDGPAQETAAAKAGCSTTYLQSQIYVTQ